LFFSFTTSSASIPNLPYTTCWVGEVGNRAGLGRGGGKGKKRLLLFLWVFQPLEYPKE
jgi:hypothetical protein